MADSQDCHIGMKKCTAGQTALAAKRAAIQAAVAAARGSADAEGNKISNTEPVFLAIKPESADAGAAAMSVCDDEDLAAKRAAMFAAVTAARESAAAQDALALQMAIEAAVAAASGTAAPNAPRKLTPKDIALDFNEAAVECSKSKVLKERDFRQQENFGATKFIKP